MRYLLMIFACVLLGCVESKGSGTDHRTRTVQVGHDAPVPDPVLLELEAVKRELVALKAAKPKAAAKVPLVLVTSPTCVVCPRAEAVLRRSKRFDLSVQQYDPEKEPRFDSLPGWIWRTPNGKRWKAEGWYGEQELWERYLETVDGGAKQSSVAAGEPVYAAPLVSEPVYVSEPFVVRDSLIDTPPLFVPAPGRFAFKFKSKWRSW